MNKVFSDDSWADYLYWQTQDKKTLKRINPSCRILSETDTMGSAIPSCGRDCLAIGVAALTRKIGWFTRLWTAQSGSPSAARITAIIERANQAMHRGRPLDSRSRWTGGRR